MSEAFYPTIAYAAANVLHPQSNSDRLLLGGATDDGVSALQIIAGGSNHVKLGDTGEGAAVHVLDGGILVDAGNGIYLSDLISIGDTTGTKARIGTDGSVFFDAGAITTDGSGQITIGTRIVVVGPVIADPSALGYGYPVQVEGPSYFHSGDDGKPLAVFQKTADGSGNASLMYFFNDDLYGANFAVVNNICIIQGGQFNVTNDWNFAVQYYGGNFLVGTISDDNSGAKLQVAGNVSTSNGSRLIDFTGGFVIDLNTRTLLNSGDVVFRWQIANPNGGGSLECYGNLLSAVADPISVQDAATKNYVDTFGGSSSIATLGTILTGVWQGTAIDDAYISSATTWNAKYGSGSSPSFVNVGASGGINSSAAQTIITPTGGSAFGTIICSQPFAGSSYKKVIIYFNTYTRGTNAQVYPFPTPFTKTPVVAFSNVTVTATVATSSYTVTAATAQTGFVILEGY